jgi:hypothetical protein
MSRLVLNGNTTKLLGTYLPVPYIERVTLSSNNILNVKSGIIVENKEEVVLYSDGELVNDEIVQKQNLDDLYYYNMIFLASSRAGALPAEDSPIFYYNQIVNDGLNPFEFFYASGSAINQNQIDGNKVFMTSLSSIDASSKLQEPVEVFDTEGNTFLSYPYEFDSELEFVWSDVQDLKVITFSSAYEYDESNFSDEELSNISFLDIKISDITYESVIENGELADPYKVLFFDQSGRLYNGDPLLSIDLTPYKTNKVTNEEIVTYFKALLEDYREQYEAENGFRELKSVMNNIYKTLELKKYNASLLVSLNNIAISFPDKTPIRPIGKLYKRFRNRIFTVNNQIKNSEQLNRKKIYDNKIFNNREIEPEVQVESLFIEGSKQEEVTYYSTANNLTAEFLYKDWTANIYTNDDLEEQNKDIMFGTFFFDYEKALRRTSAISKIYNIEKLDKLGMQIPWDKFRTILTRASREFNIENTFGNEELYPYATHIYSSFDEEKNYPLTKNVFLYEEKLDSTVESGEDEHYALTPASENWGADGSFSIYSDAIEGGALDARTEAAYNSYISDNQESYCGQRNRVLAELRVYLEALESGGVGEGTIDMGAEERLREQLAIEQEKCSSLEEDASAYAAEYIEQYIEDFENSKRNNGFYQNPYVANREDPNDEETYNVTYDALNSCVTSLVFRQFADLSKVQNNYGIDQSGISNYRMMMFQMLDYRVNDFGETNYNARVYIKDDTHELINHMTASCRMAFNDFSQYYEYARENCSFNNNTLVFNDFFGDAMSQVYGKQPAKFPWYKAPVIFSIHQDLVDNLYNGDEAEIKKVVQNLQTQLDPNTGNIEAITAFYENFKNFIDTNYGATAGETEGTRLGDLSTRYCCYTEYLNPIS